MDAHDLIVKLKDLAIDLGRTPTRDEFKKHIRCGNDAIVKSFGSYTTLIQAAGLDSPRAKRVTNEIFNRPLERHLEEYHAQPRHVSAITEGLPTLAVISDIHWPFSSQRVIDRFYEYVGDEKPDLVAINGDAFDAYSHAKFPRSHNQFTPRDEERMSREMNEVFWAEIKKRHPRGRCIQMLGNHDVRPMKRILEVYPEAEDWIKERMTKLFTFDGVETMFDARQEFYLNSSTILFHGHRSKLGDHRDSTLMNCINGHSHLGGVVYRKVRGSVIWELNSGFAGDPESKGLSYTPQKITIWTTGFGAINKYGPQFIPVA